MKTNQLFENRIKRFCVEYAELEKHTNTAVELQTEIKNIIEANLKLLAEMDGENANIIYSKQKELSEIIEKDTNKFFDITRNIQEKQNTFIGNVQKLIHEIQKLNADDDISSSVWDKIRSV